MQAILKANGRRYQLRNNYQNKDFCPFSVLQVHCALYALRNKVHYAVPCKRSYCKLMKLWNLKACKVKLYKRTKFANIRKHIFVDNWGIFELYPWNCLGSFRTLRSDFETLISGFPCHFFAEFLRNTSYKHFDLIFCLIFARLLRIPQCHAGMEFCVNVAGEASR